MKGLDMSGSFAGIPLREIPTKEARLIQQAAYVFFAWVTSSSACFYLPAAGYRNYNGTLNNVGSNGLYWSSTVNSTNSYNLQFNSSNVYPANNTNRGNGMSVRCVSELNIDPILKDSLSFLTYFNTLKKLKGSQKKSKVFTENKTKGLYMSGSFAGIPLREIPVKEARLIQQAAYAFFAWVTSSSACFYLPAAGYRPYNGGALGSVGSDGYYWSSTVTSASSYSLYFGSGSVGPTGNPYRGHGMSVRCVSELNINLILKQSLSFLTYTDTLKKLKGSQNKTKGLPMSESFAGIPLWEFPVKEARLIQQAAYAFFAWVTSSSACFYLPAAGYRANNGTLNNVGSNGYYWSSTVNSTNSHILNFNSGNVNPANNNNRGNGHSVRCVSELNINLILKDSIRNENKRFTNE